MTEHAKHFFKEPLLHFLLLGAAIFVVFDSVSKHAADVPDEIVVSQAKIGALADKFARTWQRTPDDAELNGLIQDFVRDEVAVREAAAMGIDRDDTAIRRRGVTGLAGRVSGTSSVATSRASPASAAERMNGAAKPADS